MAARKKVVPLRARAAASTPPSPHDLAEDLALEICGTTALLAILLDWGRVDDGEMLEGLYQIRRNLERIHAQAGALVVMLQEKRAQKGGA